MTAKENTVDNTKENAMENHTLQVVGAGLPRTGTSSLKVMLSQLLDGPCYHMKELYERRDVDGSKWLAALDGDLDQLDDVVRGWSAAVDWPASVMWKELAERHPDALVLLSHRGSADTWWASADATVWQVMREIQASSMPEHVAGLHQLMRKVARFTDDLDDGAAARSRYDQHYDEVVATIPAERLLVWQPSDGWEPLCDRLGAPVPTEAPAHANSRTDFQRRHEANRPAPS